MNEFKFILAAGDRPVLLDTLVSGNGTADESLTTPVNLTGCTVRFRFQGPGVAFDQPATVTAAATGQVSYTFAAGQTDVDGDYRAEWWVSGNGAVATYPAAGFAFQIRPALPVSAYTASLTKLSDFYDDIRALVGDFQKHLYEDSALASVLRLQLRAGRIATDDGRTWSLAPDGLSLTPAIAPADVTAYALLVYHAAHTLVLPNLAAYSYRTRAMSEHFGEQKDFLFQLQTQLWELENGNAIWANVTGLRSWLFAVNGIWVWSYLQAERQIDLSYK